jgi:uncharacterized protein YbjT (DUF2867 family)
MSTTLVVGATGLLGRATVPELIRRGQSVRALVRDVRRAEALARAGVELVEGDLTDAASLERACKGALRVFACAHALLGRGENRSALVDHVGHSALVAAARSAGVMRFVYTSAMGAREDHPVDFWRTKFEVEELLRESGLSYTILRPSAFMETHVHRLIGAPLLQRNVAVLIGPANKPRNFVAARDVVPFAVMALTGDALEDRTLEIGGPDNLSNRDVAVIYQMRVRRGRIVHVPLALSRLGAAMLRPWHEGVARVLDIAALDDHEMPETWEPHRLLHEFPVKLTPVDPFIDEQVRAWRRSRVGRRG